jgi:hypothetical protein
MRWLWLERTQLDKPWAAFPIQVQEPVKAVFAAAMNTTVGDGNTTLFWTDNWLHGLSLLSWPLTFSPWSRNGDGIDVKLVKCCMSINGLTASGVLSVSVAGLAEFIGIVDLQEEV